jgi:hypothetical protein
MNGEGWDYLYGAALVLMLVVFVVALGWLFG